MAATKMPATEASELNNKSDVALRICDLQTTAPMTEPAITPGEAAPPAAVEAAFAGGSEGGEGGASGLVSNLQTNLIDIPAGTPLRSHVLFLRVSECSLCWQVASWK